MSDAFWHATKAYNTREDCGLIHRFRLGDQAIEMMEKEGVIGPADGARPREVIARSDYG